MPLDDDHRLAGTYNFRVTLRRSESVEERENRGDAPRDADAAESIGDGGFQECSGLDVEMDVQELQEGGRNDGVIRQVGRGKYANLVLKRGMFFGEGGGVDTQLWGWLQGILAGERPVTRVDGAVRLLGHDGRTVLATWVFDRGLPARIAGPTLNARTGDVAVEELQIAHEGLRLALD